MVLVQHGLQGEGLSKPLSSFSKFQHDDGARLWERSRLANVEVSTMNLCRLVGYNHGFCKKWLSFSEAYIWTLMTSWIHQLLSKPYRYHNFE